MTNENLLDPRTLAADTGAPRLVLTAIFEPVGGADRFQPAGFPEIGHVIYDAPRANAASEKVCIVDSAASMANHLESVCMRSPWDTDLAPELNGLPYLRCVTDSGWPEHQPPQDGAIEREKLETVVTSFTEGHRAASTYFLAGKRVNGSGLAEDVFEKELERECGILPLGKKKAHPPPEAWWKVFSALFEYDPNSLVHGVMFPQWQVKLPRLLTAHLEAFGAARVDSSGVKFDKQLGPKSDKRVQAIFAKDEETAREIRATFILDLSLVRSFGRGKKDGGGDQKGLHDTQRVFLVAFALWKIGRLVSGPFRFRTSCDLECTKLVEGTGRQACDGDDLRSQLGSIKLQGFIEDADFPTNPVTDIYWPADDLYRAGEDETGGEDDEQDENADSEG